MLFVEQADVPATLERVRQTDGPFRIEFSVSYSVYRLTVIFSQSCLDVDAFGRMESIAHTPPPPSHLPPTSASLPNKMTAKY